MELTGIADLRVAAEHLERGQADKPLAAEAEALARSGDSGMAVVLLAEADARAVLLAWLSGFDHQSVHLRMFEPRNLIEVKLIERDYALAFNREGATTFDDLGSFLEAVQEAQVEPGVLSHMRLGPAQTSGGANLTVFVPSSLDVTADVQTILDRARGRPIILAVAVSPGQPTSPALREAIAMLSPSATAIWPVVCADMVTGRSAWARLSGSSLPQLPISFMPPDTAEPLPTFVAGGLEDPLRAKIAATARLARTVALADMIGERHEAEVRQLETRQRRETRAERAQDGGREQETRSFFERLKAQIADDLSSLTQRLRENGRRATLRTGELPQLIEQLLASLGEADLERETSHKVVRITLRRSVADEIQSRVLNVVRRLIREDCVVIRDQFDTTRRDVELAISDLGIQDRSLALAPPDAEQFVTPIAEMFHVDARYRGEVPRRGFLQRLGEGRRYVFVVLMIFSLAGSFMGFNIRQASGVGLLFLVLFLSVVLYTYFSWKKEDAVNLDDELHKLRDVLSSEFSRLMSEAMRERQTRFQAFLDESKRSAGSRLDALQREAGASRQQTMEADRSSARSKLRVIENRLRQLNPIGQTLATARRALTRELSDARRELSHMSAGRPANNPLGAVPDPKPGKGA